MLNLSVVGHGAGEGHRLLALDGLDDRVHRPLRQSVVDVAEAEERPGEDAEDEAIDASGTGRDDAGDVVVRHEYAVEDGVVALRGAHAEHIPDFIDGHGPAAPRGTKACTTFGADGSLMSRPCSPIRVQAGPRLPNDFLPVKR